jgi:hypothetical protein
MRSSSHFATSRVLKILRPRRDRLIAMRAPPTAPKSDAATRGAFRLFGLQTLAAPQVVLPRLFEQIECANRARYLAPRSIRTWIFSRSTVTSRGRPMRARWPPRSAARASLSACRRCSVPDVAAMLHGRKACRLVACRRAAHAADENYRRKSSSLSVLRWDAMAAALTFGFPESDSSNASSFDSSVRQTIKA